MKRMMFFLPAIIFTMVSFSAFSQKYKTPADTVKLNSEYVKVINEVADLTSRLTIAQNNLPGYHAKAGEAASNAQSAELASSDQASKAANGDVGDARKAKRKAKNALSDAKDARSANNKEEDQEKKIATLTSQLTKKQQRLKELEDIRATLRNTQQ